MKNFGLFLSSPNFIGFLALWPSPWRVSYVHLLFTDDQKWLCSQLLKRKKKEKNEKEKKQKITRSLMVIFPPLFRFDAVLVLVGYIIKCTYEHVSISWCFFFFLMALWDLVTIKESTLLLIWISEMQGKKVVSLQSN